MSMLPSMGIIGREDVGWEGRMRDWFVDFR